MDRNPFNLVSRSGILYISAAMKCFSRHTFSVLALLCYLIGGVLIELTHHDETGILLRSQPVLSSHDCGTKEIHVSLDDARHCLACSQYAQRLSTEASRASVIIDASLVCFASLPHNNGQVFETDVLYSGKRGPPPTFA